MIEVLNHSHKEKDKRGNDVDLELQTMKYKMEKGEEEKNVSEKLCQQLKDQLVVIEGKLTRLVLLIDILISYYKLNFLVNMATWFISIKAFIIDILEYVSWKGRGRYMLTAYRFEVFFIVNVCLLCVFIADFAFMCRHLNLNSYFLTGYNNCTTNNFLLYGLRK